MPLLPSRSLPSEHGTPSELHVQWMEHRDDSDDDSSSDSNSTSESHQHNSQTTGSHTTRSQTTGSQTTGSQTGSQTAGSQATGIQANGSQATRIGGRKSNAGAIAGGVITALVVLALLLSIFVWRRRAARRNRPKVKLEIDPMSSLDGQVYPRLPDMQTIEEESLIHEDSTTVAPDHNPPPTHPQIWQVQNVNDTDGLHDLPLALIPGSVKKTTISDISKYGDVKQGLFSNEKPREMMSSPSSKVPPVPEKDKFRSIVVSSSSNSSSSSEKASSSGTGKTRSPSDAPGPSSWKEKSKERVQLLDDGDSSITTDTSSQLLTRRFSELEANDLALAAQEEVSDLRRRLSLLKQENAELTESRQDSFDRLPAYDE